MATGVRSKYHVALNSKGFILRGTPSSPRYSKEEAPSISSSLGPGDISLGNLNGSGWANHSQSDWAGGFQRLKFKDDGSFKDGQGVDVLSKYGEITLQHGFTSAASISGSHTYGAHSEHDGLLLLGTVKAGAAKIFSLASAGTLSPLSAYAGISAVNSMSRFKGDTLIGLTRTSGTLKTLVKYTGAGISGFRSANPIVRAVKTIGIRAYTAEKVASLSGDVLYYSTDLSTFTSAFQAGKNRKMPKVEELNGVPYFFIQEGKRVEMYRFDEVAEKAYPINTWDNLTNLGVGKYLSFIIISGTSNGKSVAFAFNGAKIWEIFNDQIEDASYDFSKPFVYDSALQMKGAQWDGTVWVPGIYGKYASVVYTPFANFANRPYGYVVTGSLLKIGYQDTAKYNISGFVIGSEFGSQIGGVDKLINSVNINTKALATGQTVEIYQSTDGGSSFTSIGKMSFAQDGAVKKKLLNFPSGFVTKLWNHKVELVGPGTSTPTVNDITFEYRPCPDLKKRWNLSLDASDEIYLLNRQKEQRDGKALISDLWNEKEKKRTMVFEDVDSFEVSLVSAMASGATSAMVDTTRLMPPQGRMRVLKSNQIEEMTYTSADGKAIKGITRGQKGTLARAYVSGDKIDNNYNVIISHLREEVNDTDQNKTESVAYLTLLEV